MNVLAVDLLQLRALLGSGEEKFCAKVLRAVPPAAERLGLLKEWKRAVTGFVIGDAGAALSERAPFDRATPTRADRATSLAFASILQGFAVEGLGGVFGGALPQRPLFGLEADGELVRWGGLGNDELDPFASDSLIGPIRARGLGAIGLWTDGKSGA